MSDNMKFNVEEYINSLKDDVKVIDVSQKGINYLPNLSRFTCLEKLKCSDNYLSELPPLNDSLLELHCSCNKLKKIPPLNANLKILLCSYNELEELPDFTSNLEMVCCINNRIKYLPELNNKLLDLWCAYNKISVLPNLNDNLKYLNCSSNNLTNLPELNEKLEILNCSKNELKDMPKLNIFLNKLDCSENKLKYLSFLPTSLKYLYCYFNNLESLPPVNNLEILYCSYNNLTCIPPLSTWYLTTLRSGGNPIHYVLNDTLYNYKRFSVNLNSLGEKRRRIKALKTIYKFRDVYYHLKYRQQFINLLWKTRENIAKKKYHPSNLIFLLDSLDVKYKDIEKNNNVCSDYDYSTTFDDLLNNW